jgi:hypothetical protein
MVDLKVTPDQMVDTKRLAIAAFQKRNTPQMDMESEEVESTYERLERAKKWILDPLSPGMKTWDAVMLLLLLFTATITPFEVSFLETKINPLFAVNRIVDCGFLCDMIFQFFISYTDVDGKHVLDHRRIAKRYIHSWFGIDVISILPYDVVGFAFNNENVSQLKLLRIVRLLRLLKLLRLIKAAHLLKRYESQLGVSFAVLALIKFMVILLTVAHWSACAWYISGSVTMDTTPESTGPAGFVGDSLNSLEYSSWIEHAGIKHKSLFSQYIVSLYFALTVIFSGAPPGMTE